MPDTYSETGSDRSGLRLGLPAEIRAALFDLDGVLVDTEEIHARAWEEAVDEFLREWTKTHAGQVPFDRVDEYEASFAGRPGPAGLGDFLTRRGIELEQGSPDDVPGALTVHGVVNRKERYYWEHLEASGLPLYGSSVDYVGALRAAGLACAVVSSSRDGRKVLERAGIDGLFDVVVDARSFEGEHLAGKPSPDGYLSAAEALGVDPAHAAVFEDAPAGLAAGRNGRFGWVVGVDRRGDPDQLREAGANVVVEDLSDLLGGA